MFTEQVIIETIDRINRNREDEYYYTIRMQKIPTKTEGKTTIGKKIEKLSTEKIQDDQEIYLPGLFPEAHMGKLTENTMIIFMGIHKPIITPITIQLIEFVHYFGCYYADGTKKGHSWRINASTKEQAEYYLDCYNKLILNQDLKFELTYTEEPISVHKCLQIS